MRKGGWVATMRKVQEVTEPFVRAYRRHPLATGSFSRGNEGPGVKSLGLETALRGGHHGCRQRGGGRERRGISEDSRGVDRWGRLFKSPSKCS